MSQPEIVVLVGVTGHGKSTFANALGADAPIGNGAVSMTQGFHIYDIGTGENALRIVDTQGLEDVAEAGQRPQANQDVSQKLFAHLLKGRGSSYKAVIWCVSGTRATGDLERAANLVDLLVQGNWANVFIIGRLVDLDDVNVEASRNGRGRSVNAGRHALNLYTNGVEAADRCTYRTFYHAQQGSQHRFVKEGTDQPISTDGSLRIRHDPGTDAVETRMWLKDVISRFPGTEIEFNEQTCVNCDRTGDFRALPLDCHSHPSMGHGEHDVIHRHKNEASLRLANSSTEKQFLWNANDLNFLPPPWNIALSLGTALVEEFLLSGSRPPAQAQQLVYSCCDTNVPPQVNDAEKIKRHGAENCGEGHPTWKECRLCHQDIETPGCQKQCNGPTGSDKPHQILADQKGCLDLESNHNASHVAA